MKNREIGRIISKGGNVEDIQKVVPNFPSKPQKKLLLNWAMQGLLLSGIVLY